MISDAFLTKICVPAENFFKEQQLDRLKMHFQALSESKSVYTQMKSDFTNPELKETFKKIENGFMENLKLCLQMQRASDKSFFKPYAPVTIERQPILPKHTTKQPTRTANVSAPTPPRKKQSLGV